MRAAAVALIVVAASSGVAGGTNRDSGERPSPPTTGGILNRPERIVQLGDSIASGEGTLYGYTYDAKKKQWAGGDVDVKWPGPHPDCHVSPDAYGNHVAAFFHASLSQFACTGASFVDGIVGSAIDSKSKVRRLAEFGNWATKSNLNEEYDDANPDLVLVTLGADDAQFSDVVEQCVKNALQVRELSRQRGMHPQQPWPDDPDGLLQLHTEIATELRHPDLMDRRAGEGEAKECATSEDRVHDVREPVP